MKTLNLTFKGSLAKKHVLKLSYANDQLDAETVRQAMINLANTTYSSRTVKSCTLLQLPRSTLIQFQQSFSMTKRRLP